MSNNIGDPQGRPPASEPPVVVQANQDGGSGMGVLAAVALVAVILIGLWWFGFGPGASADGGTETPTVPIESMAPMESVLPSVAP